VAQPWKATGGAQLAKNAEIGRVAATTIEVAIASLSDVEHSKRTADRAKDRAYFEQIGQLGDVEDASPITDTPSIAERLRRAYARREELRSARASIADGRTRRDRARVAAYEFSIKTIDEEIAALEREDSRPSPTA